MLPFQQVNSINSACYDDLICVADLRSPAPLPEEVRTLKANYTFYLAFEMRRIHNAHFYSRIYYDFDLSKWPWTSLSSSYIRWILFAQVEKVHMISIYYFVYQVWVGRHKDNRKYTKGTIFISLLIS